MGARVLGSCTPQHSWHRQSYALPCPSPRRGLLQYAPDLRHAGECEVLRDQAVQFATNMWRGGSTCELHIWPGAYHVFELINNPDHLLIQASKAAKDNWFKRMMTTRIE